MPLQSCEIYATDLPKVRKIIRLVYSSILVRVSFILKRVLQLKERVKERQSTIQYRDYYQR